MELLLPITPLSIIVLLCLCGRNDAAPLDDYLRIREKAIAEEESGHFGASLTLAGDEIPANECLTSAKLREIDDARADPSTFLPARNFLDARESIERSEVFKMVRLMPKGAVLHTHGASTASLMDFVLGELASWPHLHACLGGSAKLRFAFFHQTPRERCGDDWRLVADLRASDPQIIDKIKKNVSLPNANSTPGYNTDLVWKQFGEMFLIVEGLITYRPAFEKYIDRTLQELYDDNVMYMEFRGPFYRLYELNGTVHEPAVAIRIFKDTVNRFVESHPSFLGAKFIYESNRKLNRTEFDEDANVYLHLKRTFPDVIRGFDISNYEDAGHPNVYFAEKLLELSEHSSFYFHAGETNWFGHSVDENLFDAVLLNSKRIGHGFALLKHPMLMKLAKEKNIGIEVNPISNQVLGYVGDLRNHPAAHYFANNLSVIVSNDNPSFWGASGLSYDFYEAFVGIMSRKADLRALKQLAINSIAYSALNCSEKLRAFQLWERSWHEFVGYLAREYSYCKNTKS